MAVGALLLASLESTAAASGAENWTQELQGTRHLAATSEDISARITPLLGVVPGLALSPSTVFVALSGVGLACEHTPPWRDSSICTHPLIGSARRATSTWTFAALCAFAMVVFFANTGKIQGTLGKALKLAETFPTLLFGFVTASRVVVYMGDAQAVSAAALHHVLIPLTFVSMLAVLMCVRLAVEFLVWLSPFPFVDLALETAARLVTVGLLLLCVLFPQLAAALALAFFFVGALCFRWALRTAEFVVRFFLVPLLAPVLSRTRPSLVDPKLRLGTGRSTPPRVAVRAAALKLTRVKKRSIGVLHCNEEGLFFTRRSVLPGRTASRSLGVATAASCVRYPWWLELSLRDGEAEIARLALPRSHAHLEQALMKAFDIPPHAVDSHRWGERLPGLSRVWP